MPPYRHLLEHTKRTEVLVSDRQPGVACGSFPRVIQDSLAVVLLPLNKLTHHYHSPTIKQIQNTSVHQTEYRLTTNKPSFQDPI
jgi:hypothetical protein